MGVGFFEIIFLHLLRWPCDFCTMFCWDSSVMQLCLTLCDLMDCSIPVLHHLFSNSCPVMPSNHLMLCWSLLLLPSNFPCFRVFSNELALCNRWPKYGSFSFNPSSEYSGLISFRMDWFDLLAVQGTLKSLLQYHCLIESILQLSAFFIVQLSHLLG